MRSRSTSWFHRLTRVTTRAAVVIAGATILWIAPGVRGQSTVTRLSAPEGNELRRWDATVDRLNRDGALRLRRRDTDTLLAHREHERFDQYYKGVKVYGGDIVRQTDDGTTVSMFGTLHTDIDLDTEPTLTPDAAMRVIEVDSGVAMAPSRRPTLLVWPVDGGGHRLVYRGVVFTLDGGTEYFVDAHTGDIVARFDAVKRQSIVGRGNGVLGDAKKMSVVKSNGTYLATDHIRPPELTTFDMRGSTTRTLNFLNGFISLVQSDFASDTDNVWADSAIVDAHAYAGFTYDFYYLRFGRRGLDNNNLRLLSLVHPATRSQYLSQSSTIQNSFYTNAGYYGDGIMVYGEGAPITLGGQSWNYLSGGFDIVAHELTHGVTEYTSDLLYNGESGALNESFSDMMATAAEFYFQPAGSSRLNGDYLIGEDVVTPGGLRSMANPQAYGDPDHYSRRYSGPLDNGGVHINSGIPNQMYFLAIEGGVNRTSGLSTQGVGFANREQIERVMYRAFTQMMPRNATFAVARAVTIQAARDLYGANSAAERAVTQAWTAVGVN